MQHKEYLLNLLYAITLVQSIALSPGKMLLGNRSGFISISVRWFECKVNSYWFPVGKIMMVHQLLDKLKEGFLKLVKFEKACQLWEKYTIIPKFV